MKYFLILILLNVIEIGQIFANNLGILACFCLQKQNKLNKKEIRFVQLECPKDWVRFKSSGSCYKFQRYPRLNVGEAKQSCAVCALENQFDSTGNLD
jgi:hypothetical protein